MVIGFRLRSLTLIGLILPDTMAIITLHAAILIFAGIIRGCAGKGTWAA